MNFKLFYIFILALLFLNCKSKSTNENTKPIKTMEQLAQDFLSDTTEYPRIYVDQNENITLNGNPSTIEKVDKVLQYIKSRHGLILYATDHATSTPPMEGIVIELLKKYELPIR